MAEELKPCLYLGDRFPHLDGAKDICEWRNCSWPKPPHLTSSALPMGLGYCEKCPVKDHIKAEDALKARVRELRDTLEKVFERACQLCTRFSERCSECDLTKIKARLDKE